MSTSRGIISPLLVIALSRQVHLGPAGVGTLMGIAILCASLYGLYGGHLADRGHCRSLLLLSLGLMAAGCLLLPASAGWPQALAALLLVEVAYVLFGILIRTAFSLWLPAEQRARAFAQLYTLNNIGFTVGPLLGSLLAGSTASAPFWAASGLVLTALPLIVRLPGMKMPRQGSSAAPKFRQTLQRLQRDRTLVLFTLGSLLAYLVYGRFTAYLALCLMPDHNYREVLRWTSALLATNALTVIVLQYPASKLFHKDNLIAMGIAGSCLLALGLIGFSVMGSLWQWCAAMVLFTLGEITIVPTAFLFIDSIAPRAHEGSYYGAQQLANLGGAISPTLSGLVLAHHAPADLLWLLAALALLGGLFMHLAARQHAGHAAQTALNIE
jgi:MFS family permease